MTEKLEEALYTCKECKYWDNKLVVVFTANDDGKDKDIIHKYEYRCTKCSNKLEKISIEDIMKYIQCHKCN